MCKGFRGEGKALGCRMQGVTVGQNCMLRRVGGGMRKLAACMMACQENLGMRVQHGQGSGRHVTRMVVSHGAKWRAGGVWMIIEADPVVMVVISVLGVDWLTAGNCGIIVF